MMRAAHFIATVAAAIIAAPLFAQDAYPTKPVRIVVPYPPGGANDVIARIMADSLAKALKEQFVVENRGGAGGIIGTQLVADAAPDGYTLLFTSAAHAINPSLYKTIKYDTLSSFAPITQVGEGAYVLVVHPALPVKSVHELVALAKRKPGELTFASAGTGNATHLAGELFKKVTGIDIVHVPYKGGGPAVVDLIGGQVTMYFGTPAASLPHIKAGKLKPLAVTSTSRIDVLPQVPTVHESGYPRFEVTSWWVMLAPAGTPPAIVAKLNGEVVRQLKSTAVRQTLAREGVKPVGDSSNETGTFIRAEMAKWSDVIRDSRIAVN